MPPDADMSGDSEAIRDAVRGYILENLMFSSDASQLPDDVSLLDRGIIDSTGVLEIVMFLEEEFGSRSHDSDMLPENFDSVGNIVAFVADGCRRSEPARFQRLLHEASWRARRDPATATKSAVIVEGQPYTYAELLDAALRLAAALRARGVERGDRVAIYMDNTWPCVVSHLRDAARGRRVHASSIRRPRPTSSSSSSTTAARALLLTDGHLRQRIPAGACAQTAAAARS